MVRHKWCTMGWGPRKMIAIFAWAKNTFFERLLEKAPSFDDNDKDKLWRRGTHTHKRMETWTEKLDKFVDNSAETVVRNWIC